MCQEVSPAKSVFAVPLGRKFATTSEMLIALKALFAQHRRFRYRPLREMSHILANLPFDVYYSMTDTCLTLSRSKKFHNADRAIMEKCLHVAEFPCYFRNIVVSWIAEHGSTFGLAEELNAIDSAHTRSVDHILHTRDVVDAVNDVQCIISRLSDVTAPDQATKPRMTFVNEDELVNAFVTNKTDGQIHTLLRRTNSETVFEMRACWMKYERDGCELLRGEFIQQMATCCPLLLGVAAHNAYTGGLNGVVHDLMYISTQIEKAIREEDTMRTGFASRRVLDKLIGSRSVFASRTLKGFSGTPDVLEAGDTLHLILPRLSMSANDPECVTTVVRSMSSDVGTDSHGAYQVTIDQKTYFLKVLVGISEERVVEICELYSRLLTWGNSTDRAVLPRLRDATQWRFQPEHSVVFLVFDWIDGRPLADCMAGSSLAQKQTNLMDTLRALYVLHMNGISHKSLSMKSIRITNTGTAVLSNLDQGTLDGKDSGMWAFQDDDCSHSHTPITHKQTCMFHESVVGEDDEHMEGPVSRISPVPFMCAANYSHRFSESGNEMVKEAMELYAVFEIECETQLARITKFLPRWNPTLHCAMLPRLMCQCVSEPPWNTIESILLSGFSAMARVSCADTDQADVFMDPENMVMFYPVSIHDIQLPQSEASPYEYEASGDISESMANTLLDLDRAIGVAS